MAEPTDMILPLLREMRAEAAKDARASADRHADVVARLDELEATQVSFRPAPSAHSLLGKLATGDRQERIEAFGTRVHDQGERAS